MEDWSLLVEDEWDFIAAGNDCRALRNVAILCPPPGAERAVPSSSLIGKLQRQPWGEVSARKQPRAVSWELTAFLCQMGQRYQQYFYFLLLLGNLFLRVSQVESFLLHSNIV